MFMNIRTSLSALIVFLCIQTASLGINLPTDCMTSVKDAKYGAQGDGKTDDTKALIAAFCDGRSKADAASKPDFYSPYPKSIYLPAGTYLVSDSLSWIGCAMTFQGAGVGSTVIKLVDYCAKFANSAQPKAVFVSPNGNYSFRQNFYDLTIHTGIGNSGAIGLDYIANNVGSVNNVTIVSGDRKGVAGIDMSRSWPGPCLIRNVKITGFDYGIRVGCTEYGPTFESIECVNQNTAGFFNNGNICSIHGFKSTNAVPAILNKVGHVIVIDASCTGGGATAAAIDNGGNLYARNVSTSGYQSALRTKKVMTPQTSIQEFISDTVVSLFPSPKRSLGLPILAIPPTVDDPVSKWGKIVMPGYYGDSHTWQDTFNSGKSTIYFPAGIFLCSLSITVPATVKRIIGFNSQMNRYNESSPIALNLKVSSSSTEPLIIERFNGGLSIEHTSNRTIVVSNSDVTYKAKAGAGNVFFNDVGGDSFVFYPNQNIYARQLNSEGDNVHIVNKGANLWILGIKTEGKGMVVQTTNKGCTEVLGTLLYPVKTFTAADAPAFECIDANMSLIYRLATYINNGIYPKQIIETRAGLTKTFSSNPNMFYEMGLFSGFDSTKMSITPGVPNSLPFVRIQRTSLMPVMAPSIISKDERYLVSGRKVVSVRKGVVSVKQKASSGMYVMPQEKK